MENESLDINIVDLVRLLKNSKKLIFGIMLSVTALAVIVSLILPLKYTAEAEIMSLTMRRSNEIPLSGLIFGGGLAASNSAVQLIVLLKSRTLAEAIIEKLDLKPKLFKAAWDNAQQTWKNGALPPTLEDSVRALQGLVHIEDSKTKQTIQIAVTATDPALAALIANTYLDALKNLVNQNALTVSKRNRQFIEEEISKNKKEYFENGMKIAGFYHKGISSIDSMIDVNIANGELSSGGSIGDTPKEDPSKNNPENPSGTIQKVSQQFYLQYLSMRQQVLSQMNNQLYSQHAVAKLEEAKDDPAFQVVDYARVPEHKVSPKRAFIVLVSGFLSGVGAVAFVLLRNFLQTTPKVGAHTDRLCALTE